MSGRPVIIPADIRFPLERANGVQIVKTAAALARSGVATTLIVRQSDPRSTPEILALLGLTPHPALAVTRLPGFHRRGAFALSRFSFLARTWALATLALARGSIVFTRDLQLADLLLARPRFAPNRILYEAHAIEALMYAERGALYGTGERALPRKVRRLAARERRVWRRAAAFVTTTAGIRDTFAERYGKRTPVAVIPNGCDVPLERVFPGLSQERPPRVVYAGQLYPWKGVDVLVEAMVKVAGARLVILGGLAGEGDLERIRSLVAACGLAERTEMPGSVPQARVADELARATVVVVPFLKSVMTERHTSPLKAFEAMAVGRPIVCTDLPSSREFLRHGENALLVPPGDSAALAAAIQRVLSDASLARQLARQAYEEAPRFSWDARAVHLRELMEGLK
jgi:glycosyltransferase involved in cell wall biosynthesis